MLRFHPSSYVLTREIFHCLGAHHDRQNSAEESLHPYGHAIQNPEVHFEQFRTGMPIKLEEQRIRVANFW